MAVTWKKVLASGQVVSADLSATGATDAGYVLTTSALGVLSYTAKTVNSDTIDMGDGFTVTATTTGTDTTITEGDTLTITAGTGVSTTATSDGVITIVNTSPDVDHNTDINVDKTNLLARLADIAGNWTLGSTSSIDGTISGDLTVTGDLTVSGDTTTLNVSTISVEDDVIELLHNVGDDDTDSAISFGMFTAGRQSVLGHDASAQRLVVAESISSGALADIDGFVATVETHATASPVSTNLGSGIGSFWVEEDTNYLYVRVE